MLALLFLGLGLAARDAAAVIVCADTTAEIAAAIEGLDDGDSVDVRIVQGTYNFTASLAPFFYGGSVMLRGGYLPGCASRAVDPANTVLDFTNAGPASEIAFVGVQTLTLTWLTVQDVAKFRIGASNDGFEGPAIDVHNTVIRRIGGPSADTLPPIMINSGLAALDMRDNLIYDIVSPQASCALRFGHDGNASVLVNNTFGDVATAGGGPANWCFARAIAQDDPGFVSLTNNIFWSQPAQGQVVVSAGFLVSLANNTLPSYSGPAPVATTSTLNLDPLFVDAPGNNFRLQNISTALNSGTTFAPGGLPDVDLVNDPRIVGSAPDRGAYESAFDDTTTMIVSSTNNSGAGSLRQAILDANATAVPKQIRFQIPGACPRVIVLASPLPDLTVPMQILGHTQPGSTLNQAQSGFDATLCVVLHGAGPAYALRVPAAATAASVRVSGMGFSNFTGTAVQFDGGHHHVITGNQFGGAMPGSPLFSNGSNISIGSSVPAYTIGGDALSSRNLILAANGGPFSGYGILVAVGAGGGHIVNNQIGADRTLVQAVPNRVGIRVDGHSSVIRRNVVGGNSADGLQLNGNDNTVQNNQFGFRTATQVFGNGGAGVAVNGGAAQNSIGSLSVTSNPVAEGNRVAFNGESGIHLRPFAGNANLLRGNRAYQNGVALGGLNLDLGGWGPDANDAGDADNGPNTLLNYPEITVVGHADVDPATKNVPGIVGGELKTMPGTYVVDVYSGDGCVAGRGDATTHLGQTLVTVPASGVTDFTVQVTLPRIDGLRLAATATTASGSTSELGACYTLSVGDLFSDGFE